MANPNQKGLDRGGTLGQEGELEEGLNQNGTGIGGGPAGIGQNQGRGRGRESPAGRQQGGVGREPNLEKTKPNEKDVPPEEHEVD